MAKAKPIVIEPAYAAKDVALELIAQHHPHLEDAKILYLFTSQTRRKCDRVRLGSAAKLSPLMRYLSSGTAGLVEEGYDFLVLIGRAEWDGLDRAQRAALVDHELCHCWQTEQIDRHGNTSHVWSLRGHDVEEFTEVIARHGLWSRDVKELGQVAAKQLRMPESEPFEHDDAARAPYAPREAPAVEITLHRPGEPPRRVELVR